MTGPDLKSHRQAAGVSRAALARALGLSPRTLEQIEQGRWPLRSAYAQIAAQYLARRNSHRQK